ncbi:hypothetical protein [Methanobrevibacter arboriphilus]|uniref:hypothetical protein n=1 Tax=Methanobrevibacter arboriphilus TaxID=39441 RepID=UPI0006D19A70|nr:hypothetical protein [Methanobrevibacter arboriphilus]
MNSWYLDNHTSWPPSNSIYPLLISIHINTNDERTLNTFLSDKSREYLIKYGPVGARSFSTMNFLNDNDIPSYFSGCLTLTLDKNPNINNKDFIIAVDAPKEIISFLKTKTKKKSLISLIFFQLMYLFLHLNL